MGRMIVTSTKMSKVPYCMSQSGHLLYSYEELCYYIRNRAPLWLEEDTFAGLDEKMKEWGVEISGLGRMSPLEAGEAILNAGNFYHSRERETVLQYLQELAGKELIFREKEKGDMYLFYGKYKKAYLSYWTAISSLKEEEASSFKASLFHNYAIACCRFFYWKEARNWFALALHEKDTKESRQGLEFVLDMEKKGWITDGSSISEQEWMEKKKEFLQELW